jgi:hypothetical protein
LTSNDAAGGMLDVVELIGLLVAKDVDVLFCELARAINVGW